MRLVAFTRAKIIHKAEAKEMFNGIFLSKWTVTDLDLWEPGYYFAMFSNNGVLKVAIETFDGELIHVDNDKMFFTDTAWIDLPEMLLEQHYRQGREYRETIIGDRPDVN